MNVKGVVASQYLAALEMLRQAILRCPESLWDDPGHTNRFWHVAFHAIFYTHLYLQPAEKDFEPWAKQRENYQFMGRLPWPPHDKPKIGEPYSRGEVLEYLALVQEQIPDAVQSLDLSGPSGFDWLPFGKLELQFYSIRHLQHHTGELCERLGSAGDIAVEWVGMRANG